uniref:Uncharacterized protein n=1 Tax=Ananas comosus var. bracteatus TaxID=296719 RepID=A0A6V7NJE0_ANACO|nr:unnamed protein product [Ananas comosus var. bracteatus]
MAFNATADQPLGRRWFPSSTIGQYLLQIGAFNAAADMSLARRWFPSFIVRLYPPQILAFNAAVKSPYFSVDLLLPVVRRSGYLEVPSLASYSDVVCLYICLNFLILRCFDVEMWFCMRFLLPCLLFTSYSLLLSPFFEGFFLCPLVGRPTPKVLESWAQDQLPNSPKVLKTYAGRAVLGHGPNYPPGTAQVSNGLCCSEAMGLLKTAQKSPCRDGPGGHPYP